MEQQRTASPVDGIVVVVVARAAAAVESPAEVGQRGPGHKVAAGVLSDLDDKQRETERGAEEAIKVIMPIEQLCSGYNCAASSSRTPPPPSLMLSNQSSPAPTPSPHRRSSVEQSLPPPHPPQQAPLFPEQNAQRFRELERRASVDYYENANHHGMHFAPPPPEMDRLERARSAMARYNVV